MRSIAARSTILLTVLLLAAAAHAIRVEIDTGGDPDARLEIRSLVLPDGTETELYVIEAERIVLTIAGDRLIGSRIEFDTKARVARVVGRGAFQTENETIEGEDLTIAIDEESFRGRDVLIVTGAVDVVGESAARLPGRIRVQGGAFSPCSRCGQEIEDYGFRAERIELYPGDRLIAYDADILIRGRPIAQVPLLVVPLGPPDRQPRLSITRGTAVDPAEVAVDWPYVAGPNALGTFSVRYWADVDPGRSSLPGLLLGGAVERDYVGGGITHRFYTERAVGLFELFYTPSFVPDDATPREPHELRAVFRYETVAELPPPEVLILVERDDARRDRLVEYAARISDRADGVIGIFSSQGWIPLADDAGPPSYANRNTPLRTVMRLILLPEELPIRHDGIAVERLAVDLGAFEDVSNATNRSAALMPVVDAGRALVDHRVDVTQRPWTDLDVRIVNDFVGKYYSTGERLVDWYSELRAAQGFGVGRLEVVYRRDINEGETPFRFDQIPLRNRVDLSTTLQLTPSPWFGLSTTAGYVFVDTRSPDEAGFQEVRTVVELLGPPPWIDLRLENAYDPETGDPGTLDATLALRSTGDVYVAMEVEHVQDLAARPPRTGGPPVDTSETIVAAEARFGAVFALDAEVGYRWAPPADDDEGNWLPLEVGVTAGTLGQDDVVPGLRVSYRRDLDTGETLDFGVEAAARIGPVTLAALERIDPSTGRIRDSRLQAALPGTLALEAAGIVWLPPSWLGLPEDPLAPQRWSIELRDDPLVGPQAWSVEFATVLDPTLVEGRFRDSTLQGRLRLDERRFGASRVTLDAFADARVEDATASVTHLRRASLELGVDLFGRVGVQGALSYRGAFSEAAGALTTAQLTIDDLAISARLTDELYAGAMFDDVWELAADIPSRSPFNLQPTLFVAWDRCCWALFGEWDTATGRVRVALTAPGGDTGIEQSIDTALTLPGRGTP